MAFGDFITKRPTFSGQGPITGSDGISSRLWPIKRINILCNRPCNIAFFTLNTDDPDYPKFERYGERGPIQDLGNPAGNMPMTGDDPPPSDPSYGAYQDTTQRRSLGPQERKQTPNPDGGYWIDQQMQQGEGGFGGFFEGDRESDPIPGPIIPPGFGLRPGEVGPLGGGDWWDDYEPEYGDSLGGLVIPDNPFPGWRPPEALPWWVPDNFRLFYSGNKGDKVPGRANVPGGGNPDPGIGNLGWRAEGPFIQFGWKYGEHNQHEMYCGYAICARKARKLPSWWPSSDHHYDDSGRMGYRHWWPRGGMGCGAAQWAVGGGSYLQWTNDRDAGNQSNPWGETFGPNHLKPYVEVVIKWDTNLLKGVADFFEISVELDSAGDIRGAFGVGWGN